MSDTRIRKLREKVLAVLEAVPESRNSDQYLTLCIWNRYYPGLLTEVELPTGQKAKAVLLRNVMELPREDNVKRIRAKIQNEEGKFLPTSWEVAKQRKINEETWKAYCLNN